MNEEYDFGDEKITIMLNELKLLSNKLGRCPKVLEFEASLKEIDAYSRRRLEIKLGLKYNDICRKFLIDVKLNSIHDVSGEEILDSLNSLIKILGRTPKFNEFKAYSGHTFKVISRIFGKTYNELLESLNILVYSKTTKSKTTEQLLDDFYNLFIKLGKIPYLRDLERCTFTVNSGVYIRKFKNIENICKLLDIDYDSFYKNAGAGKICRDINGGLCKSKIEKEISDFFIIKNIKFDKEVKYSEIIETHTRIFDWKIYCNDRVYYIEYFGMYSRKPRGNIDKKYTLKTKKKIKDLYKSNNIGNCIFIFPNQIKNKSLEDIFKPYLNCIN